MQPTVTALTDWSLSLDTVVYFLELANQHARDTPLLNAQHAFGLFRAPGRPAELLHCFCFERHC